jgi:hypothetical protein
MCESWRAIGKVGRLLLWILREDSICSQMMNARSTHLPGSKVRKAKPALNDRFGVSFESAATPADPIATAAAPPTLPAAEQPLGLTDPPDTAPNLADDPTGKR